MHTQYAGKKTACNISYPLLRAHNASGGAHILALRRHVVLLMVTQVDETCCSNSILHGAVAALQAYLLHLLSAQIALVDVVLGEFRPCVLLETHQCALALGAAEWAGWCQGGAQTTASHTCLCCDHNCLC